MKPQLKAQTMSGSEKSVEPAYSSYMQGGMNWRSTESEGIGAGLGGMHSGPIKTSFSLRPNRDHVERNDISVRRDPTRWMVSTSGAEEEGTRERKGRTVRTGESTEDNALPSGVDS